MIKSVKLRSLLRFIIFGVGLVFCLVYCVAIALKHVNPQFHKYIYLYQLWACNGITGHSIEDESFLAPPQGYKGVWIDWDKHGRLRSKMHYSGKTFNGECTFYYPNGIRQWQCVFVLGKPNGLFNNWYTVIP